MSEPTNNSMIIAPFSIARLPRILFGEGSVAEIPAQVAAFGKRVLIVTGAKSFRATAHWETLLQSLREQKISSETITIAGEPSPNLIDQIVQDYQDKNIEVVLGIGGGSVLDAAKAIAGLLPHRNSVMDHLEGVGKGIPYQGPAIPFIAVPTTAGTGSEATKNAVLSQQSKQNGFKKSFRHESLVPEVAIIDSTLLASCPPDLLAANGMDAFTQLLESYVSKNANPFTDALALSGITAFRQGFFAAWENGASAGRSQMAYASLLSGITLAQVGLGSVHGLASPLGAYFPCPHGVVCGTLVAEATDINIQALRERAPNSVALQKYAEIGGLLSDGTSFDTNAKSPAEMADRLVETLRNWTKRLALPKLSAYGMQPTDIDQVVAHCRGGSMKTNPIVLTDAELSELLRRRL
jgi:alcohol dehydrogenase class IV